MGESTAWKTSGDESNATGPRSGQQEKCVVAGVDVRRLVDDHHRFVWRLLGRLGVRESDLDDATQQVFMVLVQRSNLEIRQGSERSFLFGVALNVTRTYKRSLARRRESAELAPDVADGSASPEDLAEAHQARRLLDEILESMPMELRVPFVLFELEDVGSAEIAGMLGVPRGTVASRLRRARVWFQERVEARSLGTAEQGRVG